MHIGTAFQHMKQGHVTTVRSSSRVSTTDEARVEANRGFNAGGRARAASSRAKGKAKVCHFRYLDAHVTAQQTRHDLYQDSMKSAPAAAPSATQTKQKGKGKAMDKDPTSDWLKFYQVIMNPYGVVSIIVPDAQQPQANDSDHGFSFYRSPWVVTATTSLPLVKTPTNQS